MFKKIKNKWTRFLSLSILVLFCIGNGKSFAQIAIPDIKGFDEIEPGIASPYEWNAMLGFYPKWSSDGGSYVVFSDASISNTKITVNKNYPGCGITLTVKYIDANLVEKSSTKTISVSPFLTGPSVIYPGDLGSIRMQDNCAFVGECRNFCQWDWSCNDMSALNCGGCTNYISSVGLKCPTTLPASIINSGLYTISSNQDCIGGPGLGFCSWTPTPLNITVALQTPTITGQTGIGCGGAPTNGLVYIASPVVGATYYVWTKPDGWSYVSAGNTNQITVNSNGSSGGNITVRAYAANGSPVKSNLFTFPVVCCPTNLPITANVNSGSIDHQQAANTINATNTINSGAVARYHAGISMTLSNGFKALNGSSFHGYIEGCTGTYKMLRPSVSEEDDEYLINNNDIDEPATKDISLNTKGVNDDVKVYPNPNNGNFKLILNSNIELPQSITIHDCQGKEVKSISMPNAYELDVDLASYDNGLYIINVYYTNSVQSKRIVKQ